MNSLFLCVDYHILNQLHFDKTQKKKKRASLFLILEEKVSVSPYCKLCSGGPVIYVFLSCFFFFLAVPIAYLFSPASVESELPLPAHR